MRSEQELRNVQRGALAVEMSRVQVTRESRKTEVHFNKQVLSALSESGTWIQVLFFISGKTLWTRRM